MIGPPPRSALFPHTTLSRSIQDVLPAGATYVGLAAGSQVTAANSGSVPTLGATGTIVFRASSPGVTYAIAAGEDRKSTRLNSSHANISYAVFCLKKQHIWIR